MVILIALVVGLAAGTVFGVALEKYLDDRFVYGPGGNLSFWMYLYGATVMLGYKIRELVRVAR